MASETVLQTETHLVTINESLDISISRVKFDNAGVDVSEHVHILREELGPLLYKFVNICGTTEKLALRMFLAKAGFHE